MDETFGAENFSALISFVKNSGQTTTLLSGNCDYILWYARDKSRVKFRRLFYDKSFGSDFAERYDGVELFDGTRRAMSIGEKQDGLQIPEGAKLYALQPAISAGFNANTTIDYLLSGKTFHPGMNRQWKYTKPGMDRLASKNRLVGLGKMIYYVRYLQDFPAYAIGTNWNDTQDRLSKLYVVQTVPKVIERCLLMCTDPGDLVFDPTCGSGTTAVVAEQWGRRWITCDTSRVPLALARQRVLTATFPYYELKDPQSGPQGGFVYTRRQNRKGEEVGGLVPHITLKSIANDQPPATEVLVDRPEVNASVVRVAGPFVVEATIAPAQVVDEPAEGEPAAATTHAAPPPPWAAHGDPATHIERMTQVLRQSRTLRLPGNRELVLEGIRRMSDSDVLHAEGLDAEGQRIAIVFGPEDGALSSNLVFEAAREAYFLKFAHLYFFAFAIQAKARELLEDRAKLRIASTYVTVTPDVAMSDLLKTSRASEIFSVTGLPDAVVRKSEKKNDEGTALYQVELKGLDIFNPATMEQESTEGQNLPAWMLDTDYDGMCFYATQVFFPKTAAWDNLQKSLKADFDPSVWEHLAGTVSEPFALGERRRVAVKVIDERGNELMRVLEAGA